MSKKKISSDNLIFAELAKAMEGQVLDGDHAIPYYVDSGSLSFNYALSGKFLGGGLPGGRIVEIFGPESSGKSYWGTNIVRGTQAIGGISIYLDCENSLTVSFVTSASHVDTSKLAVFSPETLERAFLKIHNIIRAVRAKFGNDVPLVIVYDSLSVSPCEREYRETTVSEKCTQAEWKRKVGAKEQPGERGKICSKEFRKLEPVLKKYNVTLVIINQTRMKVGVQYGDPIVTAGGGESLKFYAGCRVKTMTAKKIEHAKLGTTIGVNLRLKTVKNKCFKPYWEVDGVQLYFDKGINPLSGMLTCLLQSERIESPKPGTYVVKEPWADGKSVTFRASKEKNLIDADILCQCPKLVDASTEEEVRAYLDIFKNAIDMTANVDAIEKEVKNQDELMTVDDYDAEKELEG